MSCAVIGSGLLGTRIACELAYHGIKVNVYDASPHQLKSFMHVSEEWNVNLQRSGLIESTAKFCGNISLFSSLPDALQDVDFIFEAVPDKLEIKRPLFHDLTRFCGSSTIIGTNTLALKIEAIAEDALFTERILGIRFFFPVFAIPIIEYSTSCTTSEEAIQKARLFFNSIGKQLVFKEKDAIPKNLTSDAVAMYEQGQRRKVALTQAVNVKSIQNLSSDSKKNQTHHEDQATLVAVPSGHGVTAAGMGDTTATHHGQDDAVATHHGQSLSNLNEQQPTQETETQETETPERAHSRLESSEDECVVCNENPIDAVLIPCRHMWLCSKCANLLKTAREPCPACRCAIDVVVTVFKP